MLQSVSRYPICLRHFRQSGLLIRKLVMFSATWAQIAARRPKAAVMDADATKQFLSLVLVYNVAKNLTPKKFISDLAELTLGVPRTLKFGCQRLLKD